MAEPSTDTTTERERCSELFAKVVNHPTTRNLDAFWRAVRNGSNPQTFTAPDQH